MPGTDLSIIIPAHNEADKTSRDITAAADFLKGANLASDIAESKGKGTSYTEAPNSASTNTPQLR